MTSGLFEKATRKTNRPRRAEGEASTEVSFTVPASLRLVFNREAEAEGVSLSYLLSSAGERLCQITRDARENGLLPMPAKIAEEHLPVIASAAERSGMPVARWIEHVVWDAAAKATAPENNRAETA